MGLVTIAVALTLAPRADGQANSLLEGTVNTKDGQPLAGVSVYGSESKACCPFKRETTTTDEKGAFHLESPGAVVHFSKANFEPQALVVQHSTSQLRIELAPLGEDFIAPVCGARKSATKRVGWQVRFDVPRRGVKLLGGKTDVDYVRYLVKPKTGDSYLELWFGPYAISTMPDDNTFVSSVEFSQRQIVALNAGTVGTDSRGQLRSQEKWRQTVIAGMGGSRYKASGAEDAALFDQIVNTLCTVPFSDPDSKEANSESKP